MAQYLLDTNIVSYLAKVSFPALNHRFQRTPKNSFVLSAITEGEVRLGLASLHPGARAHRIMSLYLLGLEIEAWDTHCAQRYASLAATQKQKGEPLSQADTMIAAHALAHGYTLITHDQAFFRIPNLAVEDWTQGPLPA